MTEAKETKFGAEFFKRVAALRAEHERNPRTRRERALPLRKGDSAHRVSVYYKSLVAPLWRTCPYVHIRLHNDPPSVKFVKGKAEMLQSACYVVVDRHQGQGSTMPFFLKPSTGQLLCMRPVLEEPCPLAQSITRLLEVYAQTELTCATQPIIDEERKGQEYLYTSAAAYVLALTDLSAQQALDAVKANKCRLAEEIEKVLLS